MVFIFRVSKCVLQLQTPCPPFRREECVRGIVDASSLKKCFHRFTKELWLTSYGPDSLIIKRKCERQYCSFLISLVDKGKGEAGCKHLVICVPYRITLIHAFIKWHDDSYLVELFCCCQPCRTEILCDKFLSQCLAYHKLSTNLKKKKKERNSVLAMFIDYGIKEMYSLE